MVLSFFWKLAPEPAITGWKQQRKGFVKKASDMASGVLSAFQTALLRRVNICIGSIVNTFPELSGLRVGERMADGTRYAGISPDTGEPIYTTPMDAPLVLSFSQAEAYAAALDVHGHRDWRIPTKGELKLLFRNCAAIGGFDETGSDPTGRGQYWSSLEDRSSIYSHLWVLRFSDGSHGLQYNRCRSSLRCVR